MTELMLQRNYFLSALEFQNPLPLSHPLRAGFRYIHSEIRLSHLGPRVHINRDETAEVLGPKISPQHCSTMQIKLRKATNASLNRVYFFFCHHVTSTLMICIESSFQTSVLLSRTTMPLQRQKQRFQKLFE
ncbi:hypothetical protein CEXT_810621 [Caerostris extrusa]|uniref:Uncharacterized protein n=1 Tax=Caerostris extrusa TaxID=172846 RepID=A0AAV4QLK9_CAEEX|nr:hypothetical protein CEXT_810621 [Caerostris extrusa]